MTPKKTVTLADDVYEAVKQRAEAQGVSLDEAVNDAVRAGLAEAGKSQRPVGQRDYRREMAEAQSDDEAIEIATDAVHEARAERGR